MRWGHENLFELEADLTFEIVASVVKDMMVHTHKNMLQAVVLLATWMRYDNTSATSRSKGS